MNISDLSKPNEFSYNCQMTRGNVKAIATVRQESLRPFCGAYQMDTNAYNVTRAALGKRQQQAAADLRLECKGNLARALYAAGWTSEQRTWGGSEYVLWWPPVK